MGQEGEQRAKATRLVFSTDPQAGSSGFLRADEWATGILARFTAPGDASLR